VRGPVWYAKYRLPDGRQVQKKLGPAWTERGRPPAGYFTKRTAEARLREILDQVRRGTLAGQAQTGVTFADAAGVAALYRGGPGAQAVDTQGLPVRASGLLPAFGSEPVEADHAGGHRAVAPVADLNCRTGRRTSF
jgi:hypothetical protein